MKITITPGTKAGAWNVQVDNLPAVDNPHMLVATVLATATKQVLDIAMGESLGPRGQGPSIQIAQPGQVPPPPPIKG